MRTVRERVGACKYMQVDCNSASAAFERLVAALNQPRDRSRLRAALVDDVELVRHAPGERGVAPVAEVFTGIAAVERWFARTPAAVQFALAGAPSREPASHDDASAWRIEYTYTAAEFHHGGLWVARLACDGRIAHLSHHPFALRAPSAPPHAHGGTGHAHGG